MRPLCPSADKRPVSGTSNHALNKRRFLCPRLIAFVSIVITLNNVSISLTVESLREAPLQ